MEFVKAKHGYFDGKNRPNIIVVHTIEYPLNKKGAEWCADFFAGNKGLTAPKASAHYTVDMDSAVQCVKDEDGAWHTPGKIKGVEINRQSIGIEHAGYAKFTEAEWASEDARAMLEVSAELVARLCYEHRISVIRLTHEQLRAGESGICGHVDCSKVAGGTHWDPGPNFPWEHYMERVLYYHELHAFMVHGKLLLQSPRHVPSTGVDTVPRVSQTCDWVIVEHEGKRYRVSPYYMPYVSIGGAAKMAEEAGWIIPTPGLVDAIWRQADLKIDGNAVIMPHDGTPKTMASVETYEKKNSIIAGLVGDGKHKLLAGAFKDIVKVDGKLGIYGMHDLTGKPIQPFYSKHHLGWVDYSQGYRPIEEEA